MKKFIPLTLVIFLFRWLPASTPTWAQDVAPILYANCASCHHAGSIAPFSLLTYADAYTHASLMYSDLGAGIMPPWPPDTAYSRFQHERTLTAAQISTIQQWALGGKPEGDVTLAPSIPTFPSGSQLGTVDLSVVIPTYTVSGTGDVYRNFPIAINVPAGSYITAVEVIPGNTAIVHHVLVYQDSTTTPATLDANAPGPGYTNAGGTGSNASVLINGWVPGSSPYYTPVGTGFRLPASTNIVIQVHYPNGSQGQLDSTRVNFKLTTVPQRNIAVSPVLNHLSDMTNGPINIPANSTKTYYEQYTVPANITVLATTPHMHLIGQSIKAWANKPTTGDTIKFINIPNWNFHWQGTYAFRNAIKVPSGSILHASAYYDNTANNPNNPNSPPQAVTAGENTTNEMMIVFFSYIPYANGDTDIIIDRRVIPQGATSFCSGQSVQLQTIVGARYTYQWYKNGTSISGATGSTYTASQAGNYWVHIGLGANSTYSDTIAVSTISNIPAAQISNVGPAAICNGQSLTLNAITGTGYTYQWFSDSIPLSAATGASFTASAAGNYSVQVYNGCYAKSSVLPVTSASAPTATVTATGATTFCQGASVNLSGTAGLNYSWSNGATTQSITVNQAGSYTLTVTNSGNCSASSTATTVTVNTAPTASITNTGNTAFCEGQSVTLNAPAGLTYSWSNGSTTQSITATQTGSFTVTVTNSNNCSAVSSSVQVTAHTLPTVTISANGSSSFCAGGSVTLTANSNSTYNWNNGSTTQAITANAAGSYSITVTDANNCSNTASTTVTVYSLPNATITASSTAICPGQAVTLTAPSATSYSWSSGQTSQQIDVSPSVNTSYTLTVTDAHSCSAVSTPIAITVSNNATASVTASGPTAFCNGGNVTLTANTGSAYIWSNGATTQAVTVNAGGSYTVTVTVGGSCTATSNPQVITTYQNPGTPTLSAGGPTTFCAGNSVSLTGPAGFAAYIWSNGASAQQVSITDAGTYALTITDANGCSASSQATTVTVNALPLVSLSVDTAVCSNVSQVALTGGLPVGGNYSGTAVNGTGFSPITAGTGSFPITYTYTDNNGCVNTAMQSITVKACLGISNIALQQIALMPNPNNGHFEVNWTAANVQVTEISVFDLQGKLVHTELTTVPGKQNLDLQNIAPACYLLLLKTNEGPVYKKLVIER